MIYKVRVQFPTPNGSETNERKFVFALHKRHESHQQLKDLYPKSPYEHTYEIEIQTNLRSFNALCKEYATKNRGLVSTKKKQDLHIHPGEKDGKMYVCYPPQIHTLEEAKQIADQWVIATIFHITQGCDINWLMASIAYYRKHYVRKQPEKDTFAIATDAAQSWGNIKSILDL